MEIKRAKFITSDCYGLLGWRTEFRGMSKGN